MRGKYWILGLFTLFIACSNDNGRFKIEGNFRGINQGELYIYGMNGSHQLDTIGVARGEFNYQIPLEEPMTFIIVFPNFSELPVFAEPGVTIEINGDATHLKETEIKGTKDNKEMTAFRLQSAQMTPPEFTKAASQFIKDHPESPASFYLLNKHFIQIPNADYRQARELAEVISKANPENKEISLLVKKLSGLQVLKIGEKIPSFTVTDINGNKTTSTEMNAKANAIILWSTWNYESVNIQRQLSKTMQHYGDRLNVLSICVDANIKECKRFVNRDSIKWPVVCDGLMWESPIIQKTGLSYLPDNIVFDSKGEIVGYSLNYQKLIEKFDELIE